MPKSENQRLKLLYMLDYLMENTDEEHYINYSDIAEHLKTTYKIPVERKTVYTDINLLEEYGGNTSFGLEYNRSKRGYNITWRDFELYELQLLIDCVQSSKFITQRIANDITAKLKRYTSRYNRPTLDRRTYVANRIRNKNDSVFYGIDDIHYCIAHDLKVTFQYFTYNLQKKKEYLKKGEHYIVSPYALLWNDDNYYLLAFEAGKMKHFRVDKMDNIKCADEKREGKEAFKALKLTDRSVKVFSMFSGKEENVTLRFSNHLIGVVLDRFGKDITIMPDGEKHFKIHVNVEVSPQFFAWLCGFGRAVKILSPASVADKMHEHV